MIGDQAVLPEAAVGNHTALQGQTCAGRGARTGLAVVGDDAVDPEAGVGVNLLAGRGARSSMRVPVRDGGLPGQAAVDVQDSVVRGRA